MSLLRRGLGVTAAVVAAALALAGCAAGSSPSATTAAGGADGVFPVTITDAFGETTIDSAPERVVTWGWGVTDAALALGVVPVAIPSQPYGGNAQGVLPWIEAKLASIGAATPAVLDNSTGTSVPIEAVIAQNPDLFLAPYSGLTQAEHDQLTGAGIKVVAYPSEPWSTPWQDVITIAGKALGKSAAASALLADLDATVAAKAAEHPEFQGKTISQVADANGSFFVYLQADPRVQFTEQLGFVTDPVIATLDTGEATFYTTLGYEQLDKIQSDVLLVYAPDQAAYDAFAASDQAKLLPQFAKGTVAPIVGQALVASVSPPTALSLPWGLDALVDSLAQAAAAKG